MAEPLQGYTYGRTNHGINEPNINRFKYNQLIQSKILSTMMSLCLTGDLAKLMKGK
jgi:hypothetical protein